MSEIDDLLTNNARYAGEQPTQLPSPPARRLAIVACMDARLDIFRILGLEPGDAHVIRNAGGIVTDDVIRSLAISQRKLDTREVMLVHHTQCGMATFTDAEFSETLERHSGVRPTWSAGTFADADDDVRESIATIKASPFLAQTETVRGFVYDVTTGQLKEVTS